MLFLVENYRSGSQTVHNGNDTMGVCTIQLLPEGDWDFTWHNWDFTGGRLNILCMSGM